MCNQAAVFSCWLEIPLHKFPLIPTGSSSVQAGFPVQLRQGHTHPVPFIIYSYQRESPTLIISMHLVMEVAWTQTSGSDLMLSAHSSHLRSSASLMQHQRTTLLSKELPALEGRSTVRSGHLCTNLFFAKGMFRSMHLCLAGGNNTERELFLPFP